MLDNAAPILSFCLRVALMLEFSGVKVIVWKDNTKHKNTMLEFLQVKAIVCKDSICMKHKNTKKGVATRGLPRGSPILVLLSPKHA